MTTGGSVINGTVRAPGAGPVAEARVLFTAAPVPVPDIAQLTDDDGRFTLYAPVPGRYEVACHADGFQSAMVSVEVVEGGEAVWIDVELT